MEKIVEEFQRFYSDSHVWQNTRWFGYPVSKYPQDLWTLQEIISEVKPDIIVECGTQFGGSALFMANILDLVGRGRVVSIDVQYPPIHGDHHFDWFKPEGLPVHEGITFLKGSSIAPEIVGRVRSLIRPGDVVLVDLDSNHIKAHVLAEMKVYAGLVSSGSYMIVEDTALNGHPTLPGWGEGPFEAVQEFLKTNDQFIIDRSREKFFVTANPGGYLRRR